MGNSSNVSVGKPKAAGGIFSAPVATIAPISATTALDAAYKDLGFVSDAGLANSIEVDSTDVIEWGGEKVLTVNTSRSESFAWTFIETNALVLAEVYGQANVTVDAATNSIAVLHNNRELSRRSYVFEIALTGNRVKRIVVPNGQISEVGDVTYAAGEAIGYEVTLRAYPDAAGNTAYEYIATVV